MSNDERFEAKDKQRGPFITPLKLRSLSKILS